MVFIESPMFTEDVTELLSDEAYAKLQEHLAQRPKAGALITQTGGLRKVRWRVEGGRQTRRRTRDLLPRRRTGADSDDSDLSQRHEGRSDTEGEGDST